MGIKQVEIAGRKLTIHELDDICDTVTGRTLTGSWVWDSAIFLSEWMVNQGRVEFDFQGKTVLELGAGMGIPGLTAALLGAGRVILTDVSQLLSALQTNVESNGLADRVEVRELIWGSDEFWVSQGSELGNVDLVLMSDVLYDVSEMAALAKTLRRLCGLGTKVWSASEIRSCIGDCLAELMSEGFGVVELPRQLSSFFLSSMTDATPTPWFVVFNLIPPTTQFENRNVDPLPLDKWVPL